MLGTQAWSAQLQFRAWVLISNLVATAKPDHADREFDFADLVLSACSNSEAVGDPPRLTALPSSPIRAAFLGGIGCRTGSVRGNSRHQSKKEHSCSRLSFPFAVVPWLLKQR